MLPPTIAIAATSESADPSAAMIAAITPIRASRSASMNSCGRRAPSSRAWASSPAGNPWTAAAVSATMYGRARIVWATKTTRRVPISCSELSGAPPAHSKKSTAPTSAGGSARLALATAWAVRRPRKRPSPIASPIGSPITVAIAVDTAATCSVNQMMLSSVGLPCTIIGTASLSSSQMRLMLSTVRKRSWIPPVRCCNTVSAPMSTRISAEQQERDRGLLRVVAVGR